MEFEILLKSILRHCDIAFTELKKASYFIFENMKPSAQPSAKKLLPPKQKQKEKKPSSLHLLVDTGKTIGAAYFKLASSYAKQV